MPETGKTGKGASKKDDRAVLMYCLSVSLPIAWLFCTFGLDSNIIFVTSPFDVGDSSPWLPYLTAQTVFLAIAFFAWHADRRLSGISGVLYIVATLACLGGFLMPSDIPIVVISGACLAAAGNTMLLVLWSSVYSGFAPDETEHIVLWTVIICALVMILLLWLPHTFRYILVQFIPLISLFSVRYVMRSRRGTISTTPEGKTPAEGEPTVRGSDRRRIVYMITGFGIPSLIIFLLLPFSTLGSEGTVYLLSIQRLGAGFAAALIGAFLYFRFIRSIDPRSLFFSISPFIVLVAVFIASGEQLGVSSVLLVALLVLMPQLVWICLSKLYPRSGDDDIRFFVGGNLICQISMLVAGLVAGVVIAGIGQKPYLVATVAFAAIIIVVLAGSIMGIFFTPEEADMSDTARHGDSEITDGEVYDEEITSRLAERYGLSRREAEVFSLLVKGRSTPYIRDVLFISSNTVNSHIHRIHAKTQTHSRQEIIDLFEEEKRR